MESIENFYKKDAYFEEKYKLYKDNLEKLFNEAESKIYRKEYGRGGEVLHRGFYCPSPVQDIIIGNCNRGKLIKNPRKQPDYEYCFDKNNRMILSRKLEGDIPPTIELLFYEANSVDSVEFQKVEMDNEIFVYISALTRCIYENEKIISYDLAQVFDPSEDRTDMLKNLNELYPKIEKIFREGMEKNEFLKPYIKSKSKNNNNYQAKICNEIMTEHFEYNDKALISSTLEHFNFDVKILSQDKYFYNHDSDGNIISYYVEEYDNGKKIPCVWDGHIFQV